MPHEWWSYLVWVLAASVVGFGVSALFSAMMGLARRAFLVPYMGVSAVFLYAFLRWSEIDALALFERNWGWGLLASLLVAVVLIKNVRSQPASQEATGAPLLFDVGWLGLVYGLTDGLFLNVMPALAVWEGFSQFDWAASWPGKIGVAVLALGATLLVTATYHLGYVEFRNPKVAAVLLGNGIITGAYLVSANPLGAVLSHVLMHVAAVMRGPETTLQLPPHYAAHAGHSH